MIAGAICGVMGAWTASPFYLIKTQLQAQAAKEIAFGHQHGHESMIGGLRNIYKKGGISKGLFRGAVASIPRAGVGSCAQLTSFSYCKEWLNEYQSLNNYPVGKAFIASMVGGVVVAFSMTPFDLVSTRLYNQGITIKSNYNKLLIFFIFLGVDSSGKGILYNGYADCFIKVMKKEGFLGLYKGIGPAYLRIGPHTVLSLVFWDVLNSYYRSYVGYKENSWVY